MAFTLQRDKDGVPGLHVCTELFSEAYEQRLWAALGAPPAANSGQYHVKTLRCMEREFKGPETFLTQMLELVNAVRDCGLTEELVQPNYAACLAYLPGAKAGPQFDSRYRWGEVRQRRRAC
jgi:hypothetical protein